MQLGRSRFRTELRKDAVAQGSGACNGWTFWHIETKKDLRLIDELRAEIRSEMATG